VDVLQAFRYLSDAVVTADDDYLITSWNIAAERLYGIAAAEAMSRPIAEVIAVEECPIPRTEIRRLVRETGHWRGEVVHVTAGGARVWVDWSVSRLDAPGVGPSATISVTKDISDRKRAEQELRESEARYRQLVENAAEAITVMQDGRFRFANEHALRLTGYSREDLLDRPFIDFVHPDDRALLLERHLRRLQGEPVPKLHQFRIVDRNGGTRWFEISSVLIQWGGRPATLNFVTDLTQREQERADAETSARHRLGEVFNFLPDATFVIDVEGRVIAWNRAMERLTGVAAADMLGKGDYEYALPFYGERRPMLIDLALRSREDLERRYARFLREGDVLAAEGYVPRLGDGARYLSGTAAPLRDAGGRIVGAIEGVRDATGRKRAEDGLRESEARYRLLADNSSDVIWTTTLDGRVNYISPAVLPEFGFTVEEMVGLRIEDYMAPASAELVRQAMAEELARFPENRDQSRTLELQRYAKDGAVRDIEIRVRWILGDDDRPAGLQGTTRDITARKQTEAKLRESEARYRLLADNSSDVIWTTALDGSITYISPSVERAFGFTPEEMKGMGLERYMTPASAERVRLALAEELSRFPANRNESRTLEVECLTKDGVSRDMEISVQWVLDERGAPIGTQGISRDITARKAAEDRLRDSERRYRLLTDNSSDVIWTISLDGHVTYVSPSITAQCGFTPEEMLTFTLWDYVLPDSVQKIFDILTAEMPRFPENLTESRTIELQQWTKDGSVIDIEVVTKWVLNERGEPIGVQGSTRTITERKQAEARLRESERRMADIIDFLPDPTIVVDRDGKVIAWNRAVEHLTGVNAADVLGKGDYEYAVPFYGERRPILVDLVLHPDPEREAQYPNLRRQGDFLEGEAYTPRLGDGVYLYGTAAALRDSAGEIVGAIESIRDMTERNRMAGELRQAKEAAEVASRAKSDFLANMSHEIRTPLNGIVGMLALLAESDLAPEQRQYVNLAQQSCDSLLGLIGDLLDFARIDAGKLQLNLAPFDLRAELAFLAEIFGRKAAEKSLRFGCRIGAAGPLDIVGDRLRIRQIMFNLIGNAIKFTPAGEVEVEADVTPGADGAATLRLTVADTGVGIPPDKLAIIFDQFSQADSGMNRRFGGAGLGLTIAKELTAMMGGSIDVRSRVGVGSTFTVTLPVPLAAPAALAAGEAAAALAQGGRPLRALLVEDHGVGRVAATAMLQKLNCEVTAVDSGAEALAAISREPFDVVLMDIQMPEMDGLETTRRIRRLDSAAAQTPIVAMTAYAMSGDRRRCLAAGMNDYLSKPIDARELAAAIERVRQSA
jgi:PAS domain S-box-containing protein